MSPGTIVSKYLLVIIYIVNIDVTFSVPTLEIRRHTSTLQGTSAIDCLYYLMFFSVLFLCVCVRVGYFYYLSFSLFFLLYFSPSLFSFSSFLSFVAVLLYLLCEQYRNQYLINNTSMQTNEKFAYFVMLPYPRSVTLHYIII